MASNSTGGLPPGESAPLTIITPDNQSGIVLIVTALGLSFALVSFLIRVFIRIEYRNPSRDDVACALAIVFAVVQSSIVFLAVSKGFGQTIGDVSPTDLVPMQKTLYSSDILFVITLWLTKCSVALLTLRLSPNKSHFATLNTIAFWFTILLAVISTFVIALRCNLAQPWIFIDPPCTTNLFTRWKVVAVFDMITELALFSAIIYIVLGLQLSLSKKRVVIVPFALRLLVIVPAALRLYYLNIELSSSDPTLNGVLASVCMQIEMNYAIIAATTPCLRPFMRALSTNYGGPAQQKGPRSATTTAQSNTFSLSSLSKTSKSGRSKEKGMKPLVEDLNPSQQVGLAISGDQCSGHSQDSKQMIISKHTQWAVEFEAQSADPESMSG